MNPKKLVRLSNIIGIISIMLLVYWVFIFMIVEVFGLKVFRENITETFYMSILGILALMFGALIINIMFNLTRIAQKHNNDFEAKGQKATKVGMIALLLSFPIILACLFGGDYLTSKQKEKQLIQSAQSIIKDHSNKADKLVNYTFSKEWITETQDILHILSATDRYFPYVSVIVKDSLNDSKIYLGYREHYGYSNFNDTIAPRKQDYIIETTKPERDYLNQVFNTKGDQIRFSAHDGNYQLYFPYVKNDRVVVFYFSDYKRYGKIGS